MYDMNDAGPQMNPVGELIADGNYVKLRMIVRPGGTNGATPLDAGLLRASRTSDAKLLDCEFTVVEGPFARRKLWQMFTVSGGKLDDKGQSRSWNIAKATFRAMIDSALGLDPRDESPAARQKRVIRGLKRLDGITFAARVMIEPSSDAQYNDANKLANVVVAGAPAYLPIMRGESVAAEPVKAWPRKAPTPGQQVPGWTAPPAASDKPWTGQAASTSCGSRSRRIYRPAVAQRLSAMTDDEWQAHMTQEAARAIGTWLEGRGRLHQPIAALTLADLEAMATNAITRFIVLGTERIRDRPADAEALSRHPPWRRGPCAAASPTPRQPQGR